VVEDREGWVQFNMMIDPDGRPYEIAIVDSSGIEEYEKVALEAIKGTRW
jgi:TonB family protein